ncbi:V-type ATPase 116kDa subunit family protein [Candidatus Magnetaquicoccus inordinatus]|uniref:V-type ATPase 116kDa subunit family protein n=1 Tax=Candidatus Magnetaquicoccus inordinatus TaxID=2496818 RepID=UPI00102D1A77|nr:V-type ATPase 116kDa subunit family protein [Candidatus Magnetaquicoccus inordinatus]
MFRPHAAHWFHLLVIREELPQTLALLASQQGIELEIRTEESHKLLSEEIADYLNHFQQLSRQFHAHWPEARHEALPRFYAHKQNHDNPQDVLAKALEALEQWRLEAEPLIQRLDEERARLADLTLYEELARQLLTHPQAALLDLAALREKKGNWLQVALFFLPEPLPATTIPSLLLCPISGENSHFLLASGTAEDMLTLSEQVASAKGRALSLPYWPAGRSAQILPELKERLDASRQKMQRLQQALHIIHRRYDIPEHLQAVARLQWFFSAIERVQSGPWLVRLSGWTDQNDSNLINHLFHQAGLHALLDLSEPPANVQPPTILVNPWWAKPFELFARLLGMPGQHEVDPSPLLALIAPLLFGYMFADVGQGILLTVIGLLLRKPLAISWLLISGGLSATFFGLLFGSLFCREDLLPAIWLHPTQHPLPVLAAPLFLGVLLILTGLILDGVSHYWRGHLEQWWLRQSSILLLYLGAMIGLLHPVGWILAAAALAWFLLGNRLAGDSWLTLLGHLAHLLESSLQLAVNSLSFARVGAFALAHAGLSQAVVTMADLTGHPLGAFLVLLLGNLLIMLLEGLVVSVQTTRLILFEFFVRFLRGEGRPFRPLTPPPGWLFQG